MVRLQFHTKRAVATPRRDAISTSESPSRRSGKTSGTRPELVRRYCSSSARTALVGRTSLTTAHPLACVAHVAPHRSVQGSHLDFEELGRLAV